MRKEQSGGEQLALSLDDMRKEDVLISVKQDLEKIVEKVLDQKLKLINRMLAEIQQPAPSFRDIFGGIGYILGLVGVAASFRNRR